MRATVSRTALLETLGKVKSAVPSHLILPVLKNVLVDARRGAVTVTAGDLDTFLVGSCEAKVAKAGRLCVPGKTFHEMLRSVTAEDVVLREAKGASLRIEAGKATSTIQGVQAEEFPPTLQPPRGKRTMVGDLASALGEVEYAMARDDSRPPLKGVCFAKNGELVAADGFRMAITKAGTQKAVHEQFVLPAPAVALARKLMKGKASMRSGKGVVEISQDGLTLLAKPVDGSFPKYSELIPKGGRNLAVDAGELREAVNTVTAVQPEGDIVRLQTKGRNLVVSARSEDQASCEVKVPARENEDSLQRPVPEGYPQAGGREHQTADD